jgi:pyruvate,water dikinase
MSAHLILDFADIELSDRSVAGGKGASLGELTRAGIPVPPGFVVTTPAFERALAALDADGSVRAEIRRLAAADHEPADHEPADHEPADHEPADHEPAPHSADVAGPADVARVAAGIRRRIEAAPVPDDVRAAIAARYRALGDDAPVAVRSSATGEDAADASFAGLQDTYLWVRGADEVVDHVRKCWASLYNDHSVSYRLDRGHAEDGLAMGVVVQRMVDPRCAGVMFTRSPTTGDRSVVAVEACWGLGSALVSGDVTPDSYIVNKVTGEIIKRSVSVKVRRHRRDPGGTGVRADDVPEDLRSRPCLGDEEIRALVQVARQVESHYGAPQDIEWALPADGSDIVVLQSRPETVWAGRAAEPVAAPKRRAFDHVLDSLSGGTFADRGAAG